MRFPNGTYDPETVALMGIAYDSARQEAQRCGFELSATTNTAMASRILAAIEGGERRPDTLKAYALNALDGARFPLTTDPGEEPAAAPLSPPSPRAD